MASLFFVEFVTPRFPGYVSGYITVSAACAKTVEPFTEAGVNCGLMQSRFGIPFTSGKLAYGFALKSAIFNAIEEMDGISSVLGGYYIQADHFAGLQLRRKVAAFDWHRIQAYLKGIGATRE